MKYLSGLVLAATSQMVAAQLSGTVGPTTSRADKAAVKVCNIMDYGAVADGETDISTAFTSAWSDCASGGEVYIPAGDYALENWITVKDGTGVSVNLDGTIYRTGTAGGNMIMIWNSQDIEFYSSTSTGAIQGYGYEFHKDGEYGARLLRFYKTTDFSIHDIILVDAPQFHLSLDTCENGEIYNIVIHGGYEGGLDGIDVWSSNMWIHDIEVSNKDECVTVKNPSDHILIESVHCNWSGGCAMGSLGTDTDIHDIEYSNIYTHHSNQMYMFKSNGGNGSVYNIQLNNFAGHGNAYSLDFDSAWSSMDVVEGDGIEYSNISFSSWKGTCEDGTQRGPVKMNCPALVPCYDIEIEDFSVWTESGSEVLHACYNAFGSGACLDDSNALSSYTTTQTLTTVTGYTYSTMYNELTAGFDISSSIPIPTMPASFFPGIAPKSAILGRATASSSVVASSSAASPSSSVSVVASSSVASSSAVATSSAVITSSPVLSSSIAYSSAAASSVASSSSVAVSSIAASSAAPSSAAPSSSAEVSSASATVAPISTSAAVSTVAYSSAAGTGYSYSSAAGTGYSYTITPSAQPSAVSSGYFNSTTVSSSYAASSSDAGDDCDDETTTTSSAAAAATSDAGDSGDDCDDETTSTSTAAAASATGDEGDDCDDETTTTSAAAASATGDEGDDCDDESTTTSAAAAAATTDASGDDDDCDDETSTVASVGATATGETCALETVTVTVAAVTVTVSPGATTDVAATGAATSSALTKSQTTVVSVVTVVPIAAPTSTGPPYGNGTSPYSVTAASSAATGISTGEPDCDDEE